MDAEAEAMLDGTWYVVRSSLRLWQRRGSPSITYAPLPDGRIADTVLSRGRRGWSTIVGIDTPQPDGSLVWRGVEPLTLLVRSRWRVLAHEEPLAAIRFVRTPFSEAGLDILARAPLDAVDDAAIQTLVDGLASRDDARAHLAALRPPRR